MSLSQHRTRQSAAGHSSVGFRNRAPIATTPAAAVVDIVIPVYNEQAGIEACIRKLQGYVTASLPYATRISIADNASTDDTLAIAERLAREFCDVRVFHLPEKGRGRALRTVWEQSDAQVLAYMDVDLSTDLAALGPLLAPLLSGHSDVAIGTRLAHGSHVSRGAKREVISRSYNLLLHTVLGTHFSDAQCGFKALRRDVADALLPLIRDNEWFFDTELLVLAEQAGLRVAEVPVDWTDDPVSSVHVVHTAAGDLRGVGRLVLCLGTGRIPIGDVRRELSRIPPTEGAHTLFSQLVRFAAIGLASTAAYVLIYWLVRQGTGAQFANFTALLLTAIGNTAANRFFTFGIRGSTAVVTQHLQGLAIFTLGWALTAGALFAVNATTTPSHAGELAVLVAANLLATALRFVLFRNWVFARGTHSKEQAPAFEPETP
ncbi:bifunctional glycosyltransferase family 2/GtrA family protein [Paeniglutamicibacter cryotolerans]|uniref:dolichyl-phosphate beta-glucosyltransferase n=1 Tax=Paeniglutamicibacter cryotolerans TaxID=670079 RepID=A0A839QHR7_9MICC|nr:bifunctional glycosyltransferase family 2/GtrA family protein [Paeniglutamicibacter cryotolerans]MBB2995307.1 putative flippase GtrA [Paeniglutamicibacter cryotolerans]